MANEISSVRVDLNRLSDARVIWTNERAEALDPNYPVDMPDDDYRRHLVDACAVTVATDNRCGLSGWADRYGGSGIGRHGGSGRSVLVNGYSVKGVGPTPLLGRGGGLAHASGGAYLEEAIREILFSRLLHRVLPHGASPILAIIDTGINQTWHGEDPVMTERRVLIVRPFSLRPAHFERAYRYCPDSFSGKRSDMKRVYHNFWMFSETLGVDGIKAQLESCYRNWAEQVAYAMVHNISLSSSPSNVNVNGSVIDFGAISTLKTSANYVSSPGNVLSSEFTKVRESLDEVARQAELFDLSAFGGFVAYLEATLISTFERRLSTEILSRTGLGHHHRHIADDAAAREEVIRGFLAYHRQSMRLRVPLVSSKYRVVHPPVPALESIWSYASAPSLEPLASVLNRRLPSASFKREIATAVPWAVTRETIREEIHKYVADHGPFVDLGTVISQFERRWT